LLPRFVAYGVLFVCYPPKHAREGPYIASSRPRGRRHIVFTPPPLALDGLFPPLYTPVTLALPSLPPTPGTTLTTMGSQPANPPIRLAILEADTPAPGIKEKYGSYGGVFTYLFERACKSLDPPQPLESQLSLSAYNVVDDPTSYPDPETIDAILITGSKFSAFECVEWIERLVQYTKRVLEGGRVRVIGVCFGHQIVGRAMGVEVSRNIRGWEISVVEHRLTDEGKRVFGKETLSIHQMHRDMVRSYPPGVIPLANTPVCNTQAMYLPKRMISVQGHPEFTEEMVREILEMRKYGGILNEDIFTDGMRRVADKQDGVEVAKAFLRFLHE
jgi:GMP synthase-like glutamine amidotransferase